MLFKLDPATGEVVDRLQLDADFGISDQLIAGADGKLYVLFGRAATVFEINTHFEPLREISVPGATFVDSLGIAADGTLFAGVSQDLVLIHFDQAGQLLKSFGNRSAESNVAYLPGTFYNIEKIEISNENLFVLDESVTYSYIVSMFP